MQRIYLPPEQFNFTDSTAQVLGVDYNHLVRVMRGRSGDKLIVLDSSGRAFEAIVREITKTSVLMDITSEVSAPPEPSIRITVAQALGKGDKFEQVVQHGTEVGVTAFVPIRAERSIVDIPASRIGDRLSRWSLIAKSAAEQSFRSQIPRVMEPITLPSLLRSCADRNEHVLLLQPCGYTIALKRALEDCTAPPTDITIAIGPEGGWSPSEVSFADLPNVTAVSLGPWVLRTETAALVAVSCLLYHFETT